MYLNKKTKIVILTVAAIISLLTGSVSQVYAAQGQGQNVPTLVVYVHVINDDGGWMKASDFVVAVTAKDPSLPIFSGSETGTIVTMKNSEYKVTELAVKGYNASYSPGCSGRLNNNEAVTCVITNDDISPHLKVIKHVINDDEGTANASDFTMYVNGNNPSLWSFPGSETGIDVKIGQGWYSVNEDWNPDYISSYSPECNGEINIGDTKTCTITNDDRPKAHLIVIKNVINDNDGTAKASDFTMNVNGDSPSLWSFPGSENGTTVTMYGGWYNVWEDWNPDYSQSNSPDCSGYIQDGETKTCTITNDDRPKAQITVIKKVINDNGGTASSSDFTMYLSADNLWQSFPGSETGTNVTVYEGNYYVGEYSRWDYSYSYSADCSGYIIGGETKTCTITNNDRPTAQITVIKKVINDNGGYANPSDFTMYVSADNLWQSFPGSETGTNVTLYEGWYNVGEYSRWDYSYSYSADCSGNITGGETRTCTITNDDYII